MSGLTLGPIEVTKWLAGRVHYDFGVADDRMPPLSYWAGWGWSQLFGLSERAMRGFSVVCVTAATGVVFRTALRAWGLSSAVVAGLLIASSPNVLVQAVEIRAYAQFILTSACVYYCLVRLLSGTTTDRTRWLVALVACGTAAAYTHFFGLVVTGGALLATLVVFRYQGLRVRPVLFAIVATAVLTSGLAPFVLASVGISHSDPTDSAGGRKVFDLIRLGYRIFGHPAISMSRVMTGMCLVGAGLTLSIAAASTVKRFSPVTIGLIVALVSGLVVVVVARLAQSSFNATSPTYNVWVLVGLALLLSSTVASPSRWMRRSAWAGLGLLLSADFYGALQLAVNGDHFSHTPHRPIAELLRRLGPDQVAVVYDDPPQPSQVWQVYAPLRYEFGPSLRQYQYTTVDPTGVRVKSYPDGTDDIALNGLPVQYLAVVRAKQAGAAEVADQVRYGVRPIGNGPVAETVSASGTWVQLEHATYGSFTVVDVIVFRR